MVRWCGNGHLNFTHVEEEGKVAMAILLPYLLPSEKGKWGRDHITLTLVRGGWGGHGNGGRSALPAATMLLVPPLASGAALLLLLPLPPPATVCGKGVDDHLSPSVLFASRRRIW